ncbi:MAG: hypothetical protein Q9219_004714 [cf. Caloplaca sp. 3 TL-2023]
MAPATWETIRDRKLEEQRSRIPHEWLIPPDELPPDDVEDVTDIPRTCGILSSEEIHITEHHDARGLAAAIRSKRYTAFEVTVAFCKRAAISNQLLSTLTELLFTSALSRARFLDAHLARTGLPMGPLHGLPISVKDTFHIAGVDSTAGICALAFQPASQNAPLVETLLAAGAIIHCKTNVPQTLLALHSVNNLFGRVLNPRNRKLWTAGGSSGGEGALVAMRGCAMGVGTDVGGSIRIPAFVNGVLGFKPGKGRVSAKGHTTGQLDAAGKVGLEVVVGPIARRLDDIALFMEVVEVGRMWEQDPEILFQEKWWSGYAPTQQFSMEQKLEKGQLRVGILWDDGISTILPPIRAMLAQLAAKMAETGIHILPVDPYKSGFSECQSLVNKFFSVEGNTHLLSLVESTNEPLIPWLANRLKRKQPATVDQLRTLHSRKLELETRFLTLWKGGDVQGEEGGIDFLICPVAPHPVPPPDRWNAIGYTSAFVLLDYPAGVVQVGTVGEGDLEGDVEGEVRGEWDKVNRRLWEPGMRRGYLGSPLAVQVVAPKGRERRCWEAMRIVEGIVSGGKRGRSREVRL